MRDELFSFSRYADSVTHASEETCYQRNRMMMELADEIAIGYASPGRNMERLCGSIGDIKSESLANAPTENPVAKAVSQ